MIFLLQQKEKKRSADIASLEKQKNDYEHYVAVADNVKELIEEKRVKGIDMYTHESLNNDTGAITNEQLKILIEDHTGKKIEFKR